MEDAEFILLSSYLGPAPLATTTDTDTMAPPFLLSYSELRNILAFATAKQTWFSSLLLFHT
jgi:hypothetical protein